MVTPKGLARLGELESLFSWGIASYGFWNSSVKRSVLPLTERRPTS